MTTLMPDTGHETEGAMQATPPAGAGFAPPASVPDAPCAAQPIAAEPPGSETLRPASIATVLQVALRRLSQDKAPPLPGWAVQPCASDDERFERKLARWLRRGAAL